MPRFISLPHTIEAFKFSGHETKPPQWFVEAVHTGRASVTINNKDAYITVFSKEQFEKAFLQDWVCLSDHGKIFVIDNETMKSTFRKTDDE